jgi:hypothetical protein
MAMTELPRFIRSLEAKPGYKLSLAWEGGPQATVDLTDMIQRGGVFEELRNEKLFSQVRISEDRRKIEWPEPQDQDGEPLIDIDAESLHYIATQQRGNILMNRLFSMLDKARKTFEKASTE